MNKRLSILLPFSPFSLSLFKTPNASGREFSLFSLTGMTISQLLKTYDTTQLGQDGYILL